MLGEPPVAAATDKDDASTFDKYVGEYTTVDDMGPIVVSSDSAGLHLTDSKGSCDLVPRAPAFFTCDGAGLVATDVWFTGASSGPADHVCAMGFVGKRAEPSDAGADAPAD